MDRLKGKVVFRVIILAFRSIEREEKIYVPSAWICCA